MSSASPARRRSPNIILPDNAGELERYVKYLYHKMAQVIIQSRQGEKVKTVSNPSPSAQTWFCLTIEDIPEIYMQSKHAINLPISTANNNTPFGFNANQRPTALNILSLYPLCVEISLKTSEGDSMILETWSLSLCTENGDPTIRQMNTVYNRMSLMLKSLICVSRALPAHRVARKQGPDSFVVCYRMYAGEPDTSILGLGYQTRQVGQVTTASGMLNIRVDYRTNLTFSPSDHIHSNPKHSNLMGATPAGILESGSSGNLSSTGNGSNVLQKSDSEPRELHTRPTRPFGRIADDSSDRDQITSDESQEAMRIFAASPPDPPGVLGTTPTGLPNLGDRRKLTSVSSDENIVDHIKVGAFAATSNLNDGAKSGQLSEPESDPLMELFHCEESFIDTEKFKSRAGSRRSTSTDFKSQRPLSSDLEEKALGRLSLDQRPSTPTSSPAGINVARKSVRNSKETEDNFEFLQLKTPFSTRTHATDGNQDLGVFFQTISASTTGFSPAPEQATCDQLATSHELFKKSGPRQSGGTKDVVSDLANLTDQIQNFESSLAEYEDMLKNLETSESESDAL